MNLNTNNSMQSNRKRNYIGTYVKHEFATVLTSDTKKRIYTNVFVFKPNKSQLIYDAYNIEPMPKGYTWANNIYYTYSDVISNKETFGTQNHITK